MTNLMNPSNKTINASAPSLMEKGMDIFFIFFSPVLYGSAIIGSTLVLVVLLTQQRVTKLPKTINTAICCLLLSDLVTSVIWFATDVVHRALQDSPLEMSKFVCLSYVYALVTFCNLQGYIQCIISLERVLAILLPLRVRHIVTFWRMVVTLIASFFIVCLLHVVYIVYGYEFVNGECRMEDHIVIAVFNAVIYCGLPWVIQVCCTVCIIYVLYKRHYMKVKLSQSAISIPSSEIRLAITLLAMNIVFLITTLPITLLFFLLPEHFKSNASRKKWAMRGDLAWILTMIGATTDWIILLVLGKQIRIAIRRMFRCKSDTEESLHSQGNVKLYTIVKKSDGMSYQS